MNSRVRFAGPLVQRLLAVVPSAVFAIAVVFDLVDLATGTAAFAVAAYWMTGAGLVAAMLAAPFGWIDWFAARGTAASRVEALHAVGTAVVVLMFAASWWLRDRQGTVPAAASALSVSGILVSIAATWLGGAVLAPSRMPHPAATRPGPPPH